MSAGKWVAPATLPPLLRMEVHKHDGTVVAIVPGDRIRFVSIEDGRAAFDVVATADGALEIRGIDICKIGGVLTDTRLQIEPHVTNVVTIRKMRWVL